MATRKAPEPAVEQRGAKGRDWTWRILSIIFGVATVTALGLAIFSIVRNEELAKQNKALVETNKQLNDDFRTHNERLRKLIEAYTEVNKVIVEEINANEELAKKNAQLNAQILALVRAWPQRQEQQVVAPAPRLLPPGALDIP